MGLFYKILSRFIMSVLLTWILFARITHGQTTNSFARVLHVSVTYYVSDVLDVYTDAHISNHVVDCARRCKDDTCCLSFAVNSDVSECTTYRRKFRADDRFDVPHTSLLFVKDGEVINNVPGLTDCGDLSPPYCSGVYRITPGAQISYDVYCDVDTVGGPWTVIQNRQDGDVDFYRNWEAYREGFGDLLGNFWLGNDAIHTLTSLPSELLVELVSWNGDAVYARYSIFSVADEVDSYRLTVSGYSGTANYDAMSYHNGKHFSTSDHDKDLCSCNCAEVAHGGWWYNTCIDSNLNGNYTQDHGTDVYNSMMWYTFYSDRYYVPMKKARMLIKRSLLINQLGWY